MGDDAADMKPASSEQAVFAGALQCDSPESRAAYLNQVCGPDAAFRRRVEALLRAADQAGDFLEAPPTGLGSGASSDSLFNDLTEQPGDRIGRYKLLEKIGEGGCGVVYMAEQEEPVRRRVALKVIKLGMDTRQVVARFEAERQALALMDHPNIAKVFDGGATQAGRPYFVMELVRGVRITEFCDEARLPTDARLKLFVQVCQAVQHAHQKGIIHRDLKPSNILVTVNDGAPVPKVIDFGIAKATGQRLTDKTLFTQFHLFLGTPAYTSPEQAEMSSVDIDTRSDIYSLGVLLYELLTGRTPFDGEELLRSGLDEMRRTIREKEPPKPSTRLTSLAAADVRKLTSESEPDRSSSRRLPPTKELISAVRGDLDWIVMKCLEKDRARRYETANGLAADIQRHLGNEPVAARPPSAAYRLQRMVRRNQLAFAAGIAVVLALVAGTGFSLWQATVATRAKNDALRAEAETASEARVAHEERDRAQAARREAETALADAEVIATFLSEMFQSPDPTREGRALSVPEFLGAAAAKLETELADQPDRRATLQATLGSTYHSLGLFPEAIALQDRSRVYYLGKFGREHAKTIEIMGELATSYAFAGRSDEALELREEVLELSRRVNGPEHPATLRATVQVADSYLYAARNDAARGSDALALLEGMLPLCRQVNGPEHPATLWAMHQLSTAYFHVGRRDEARTLMEAVLALSRRVNGPRHAETLWAMQDLANHYSLAGRREEALNLRQERLKLSREINGAEHPFTLSTMDHLAASLGEVGRRDEANILWEEALLVSRRLKGFEDGLTRRLVNNLADSYLVAGRIAEGLALLSEASTIDPADTESALKLGTLQLWFGMEADYAATCQRMLAWAADTRDPPSAERAAKLACLRANGEASLREAALTLARRAVSLEPTHVGLPWFQLALGIAEYRNGDYAAAEQALVMPLQATKSSDQDIRHRLAGTAGFYQAMIRFQQDQKVEAQRLFHQAAVAMKPLPESADNPLTGGANYEDVILWLAYQEARTLIGPAPAP